jgi:O-methyltransferase
MYMNLTDVSLLNLCKFATWNPVMMTPSRMLNIVSCVLGVHDIEGDIVEVGCNEGKTSCLIAQLLHIMLSSKELYVYDSFCGLQEMTDKDKTDTVFGIHPEGTFTVPKQAVTTNFWDHGLKMPHIKEGLVGDLVPDDIPQRISMAYLDVDLYAPTLYALELIWPRMSSKGVVIVDDYGRSPFHGIKCAVDEFFIPKGVEIIVPKDVDLTAIVIKN